MVQAHRSTVGLAPSLGPHLAHHRGDGGISSLSSSATWQKLLPNPLMSFSPLPITPISDYCDHFSSKCYWPDQIIFLPASPECSVQPDINSSEALLRLCWQVSPRCTPSGKRLESQGSHCRCLWVRGGRRGSRVQQLWLHLLRPAPLLDSSQQGNFSPGQVPCSHIPRGLVVKIPSPWTRSPSHIVFPLYL